MSYIFVAKKPDEFKGHPTYGGSTTMSGYTCYMLSTGTQYNASFSENEIWFNVWCGCTNNNNYYNIYVYTAKTNVSMRRPSYNDGSMSVYINNTLNGGVTHVDGLFPWQLHVKSGVNDGIVEIFRNGELLYSRKNINILNGEPITQVRLTGGSGSIKMVMRDAIVATHKIPCGQLLEEVSSDISAINGWTQDGDALSTETAGASFTIKPNAASLASLQDKAIHGLAAVFTGTASDNIPSVNVNNDETLQLLTESNTVVGKVRELSEVTAGLTVTAG